MTALGLPIAIRHLPGEPSPLALWALFMTYGNKSSRRDELRYRYFGRRVGNKRGPKPKGERDAAK